MSLLKQITNDILSVVYPNICAGCKTLLPIASENKILCDKCRAEFEFKIYKRCPVCDRIIYHRGKCRNCNSLKLYFDKGHVVLEYNDRIRDVIHSYKYKNMKSVGVYLGELMADYAERNIFYDFDIVVAVPLHKIRLKQRGYNQSEIMARVVAERVDCPYIPVLVRLVNTKPQNLFGSKERFKNVKNAFGIKKGISVENKSILIIDDIYTTGATVNECARILKQNGAARVEFFTFSCTSED